MEIEHLITALLSSSVFLVVTALLLALAKRLIFPYTVLLLIAGFVAQAILAGFNVPINLGVPTDIIYFLLLPLLLFESAIHINFHQFKLQFKTITFLSTFGLLVSITVIALVASAWAGLPWQIALLFGALISATDPIAVLAIFKNLGAPKRLALLADGESMFNDATGVIAYRVIAAAVIGGETVALSDSVNVLGSFAVIFLGSIGLGAVCAYLMSVVIAKIENDRLVETTMTVSLALGSFVIAEHFFHLSGVITTVTAGIVMGNLGKTRISVGVKSFIEELWEYIGFLALSVVFFFSTFSLQIESVFHHLPTVAIVILSVLIGRAVSVYVSCAISNRSRLFRDEPNVPMAWQHILQWGGLRGVIPLVLVYSIPDSFEYKAVLIQYTLATFLFTSCINAITIDKLLIRLGLHLQKREEEIITTEQEIFQVEQMRGKLNELSQKDFDRSIILEMQHKLHTKETTLKEHLLDISTAAVFEQSLRLQAVQIERHAIEKLYKQGHLSESAYFEFDSELDLQQDSLEHPQLTKGTRGVRANGTIDSSKTYHSRLARLTTVLHSFPTLRSLSWNGKEELILNRLSLLQGRIHASSEVIDYIQKIHTLVKENHVFSQITEQIKSEHETYRLRNAYQMQAISREEPRTYKKFQLPLISSYYET